MATLRNRSGKWQARVVRKGHIPVAKTFQSKQDAERWARQVESNMDKGSFSSPVLAERTTFKEVVERYIKEVTPTMRSLIEDTFRLKKLSKCWFAPRTDPLGQDSAQINSLTSSRLF